MKIIKSYLFILLLVAIAVSCKKDLGNYSYQKADTPQIDTLGLGSTFNVEQYSNLRVAPVIRYGGDTANLKYQWFTYVKSLSSPAIGTPKLIAESKAFDQKISIAPGSYYLELIVTDKTNQYKNTIRFILNVQASIETGWLVLHSKNNETDVDFIVTRSILPGVNEKRMRDLFLSNTGSKLKGAGQMIGFARRSNSDFNWITVATNQEMRRMHGFTFAQLAKDGELFRRAGTVINPQAYMNNSDHEMLVNNGLLHPLQWGNALDAFFSGAYRGDYYLAPYFAFNNYSAMGIWVYDQKNRRFMYTTSTLTNLDFVQCKPPANGSQPFNLSAVGKDMLFMDRGMNNYAYCFFKDPSGTGRYLYIVNITKSADDGLMAVSADDMSALPEITSARYFQVGSLGNVALYATDKAIYRYDYSGTKQAYLNFNGFGAGETITGMKIFKPTANSNAPTTDYVATNNTVVFVSTWDGTQGRVYELGMNLASGIINPTPVHVYDGFGQVTDMIFKFRGTGI
jgi:hypothetical protein